MRENADPLGYQYAPYGYAAMQLLAEAVAATNSLDQAKLADYIHSHSFKTVAARLRLVLTENGSSQALGQPISERRRQRS